MAVNTSFSDFQPPFSCVRERPDGDAERQAAQHRRVRQAAWLAWKDSECQMPLEAVLGLSDHEGCLLVNWRSIYCLLRWAKHFQWAWEQLHESNTYHYVAADLDEVDCSDGLMGCFQRGLRHRQDFQFAYWEYMASPQWFDIRNQVMARDRGLCKCGAAANQVHHRTYARLGCERLEDCEAICPACHEREHHVAGSA